MIRVLIPNKFEFKKIKIFIFFSFILIWLSISTSSEDLMIFKNYKSLNYVNLINFIRHFSVYIIFVISLLVIIQNKVKINYFSKLFIILFILQCVGIFTTDNLLSNLSYSVSSITFILTIILLMHYFNLNEINIFILITILILSLVVIFSCVPNIAKYLSGTGYLYGATFTDGIFLNKLSPRSSGISRSLLILLIFNFHFKKIYSSDKLFLIINSLLITLIFLYQSRTVVFLLLIFLILQFFIKDFNYKSFLKIIFYYFLLPIIFFCIAAEIHKNNLIANSLKITADKKNEALSKTEMIMIEKDIDDRKILRTINSDNFSSGRVDDWILIMRKFEYKNILFGYGALGDRYLINQTASNAAIYIFASSGILGTIIFINLLILKLIIVFKNLYMNKKYPYKENFFFIMIVISIMLRSILENSYSIFGIDFLLLFMLSSLVIKKEGH